MMSLGDAEVLGGDDVLVLKQIADPLDLRLLELLLFALWKYYFPDSKQLMAFIAFLISSQPNDASVCPHTVLVLVMLNEAQKPH